MLHYAFPYMEDFHCLAGACPDSCCKGWEVVIDEPTLQTYRQCSKPIGDRIRNVLTKNEDQEWIFQNQKNGNCPFWNAKKLCDLQLQADDALLCDTCRMFPRIPQNYTLFTEHVLSLACPEAAKKVLTQEEPFHAVFSHQDDSPAIPEEELPYSLDWMACLRETRSILLQLLQNPSLLLSDALCYGLHYVQQLQDWIEEKTDDFPQMQSIAAKPDFLYQEAILHMYDNMEWMTPEWADWMQQIRLHPVTKTDLQAFQTVADDLIPAFRNFCSYYLYLYWLQAIEHGNVLLQYQKLLAALYEITVISAWKLRETGSYALSDCIQIVQLYAKEVMHDAENVEKMEIILDKNGNQ